MTVSAILIPADIDEPLQRISVDGLADLQAAVEGDIEAYPYHADDTITTYGNDEAKLVDEPQMNTRATQLMGPGLFAGDYIAGNLVVCGFDHDEGENLDCPDGFEEVIVTARRELRNPDRTEIHGRTVSMEWDLFEDADAKRTMAVLSIMHDTPGVGVLSGRQHGNEFTATLGNQTEQRRTPGIVSRGFSVGAGVRLTSEAISRYSEKRREAFAAQALELLRDGYSRSHPQLTRYFKVESGGAL
jgi:hypothetical protein